MLVMSSVRAVAHVLHYFYPVLYWHRGVPRLMPSKYLGYL